MYDEIYSPFFNLTPIDRTDAWKNLVTRRGERYARVCSIDHRWFELHFDNSDHERLGLGLRIVNLNIAMGKHAEQVP